MNSSLLCAGGGRGSGNQSTALLASITSIQVANSTEVLCGVDALAGPIYAAPAVDPDTGAHSGPPLCFNISEWMVVASSPPWRNPESTRFYPLVHFMPQRLTNNEIPEILPNVVLGGGVDLTTWPGVMAQDLVQATFPNMTQTGGASPDTVIGNLVHADWTSTRASLPPTAMGGMHLLTETGGNFSDNTLQDFDLVDLNPLGYRTLLLLSGDQLEIGPQAFQAFLSVQSVDMASGAYRYDGGNSSASESLSPRAQQYPPGYGSASMTVPMAVWPDQDVAQPMSMTSWRPRLAAARGTQAVMVLRGPYLLAGYMLPCHIPSCSQGFAPGAPQVFPWDSKCIECKACSTGVQEACTYSLLKPVDYLPLLTPTVCGPAPLTPLALSPEIVRIHLILFGVLTFLSVAAALVLDSDKLKITFGVHDKRVMTSDTTDPADVFSTMTRGDTAVATGAGIDSPVPVETVVEAEPEEELIWASAQQSLTVGRESTSGLASAHVPEHLHSSCQDSDPRPAPICLPGLVAIAEGEGDADAGFLPTEVHAWAPVLHTAVTQTSIAVDMIESVRDENVRPHPSIPAACANTPSPGTQESLDSEHWRARLATAIYHAYSSVSGRVWGTYVCMLGTLSTLMFAAALPVSPMPAALTLWRLRVVSLSAFMLAYMTLAFLAVFLSLRARKGATNTTTVTSVAWLAVLILVNPRLLTAVDVVHFGFGVPLHIAVWLQMLSRRVSNVHEVLQLCVQALSALNIGLAWARVGLLPFTVIVCAASTTLLDLFQHGLPDLGAAVRRLLQEKAQPQFVEPLLGLEVSEAEGVEQGGRDDGGDRLADPTHSPVPIAARSEVRTTRISPAASMD